jgi:glycosyltransferase involved in cell wall biosynthesis
MPAYKVEYLAKAIDSILNQDHIDFELIIVNDASPENLKEIVNIYNDRRILYFENEQNIGGKDLVKNWNHCLSLANGDYIILATDDDMFEPEYLSNAAKLIEKYPNADIIRSGVKKIDKEDHILDFEFPLKEYMTNKEFALYYAKGGTISCVSNYIIKKTAIEKIGGFISFPRAHYSDDATALALTQNGIACIPLNNFKFRVSNINLSNRNDFKIVKEQLYATELYMEWYLKHIKTIDNTSDVFFERACYGGFKSRYITMIENLLSKIPFTKVYYVIHYIFSNRYLFKRERFILLSTYFINRL